MADRERAMEILCDLINKNIGERCNEYKKGCLTCQCWKLIDELKTETFK